MKYERDDILKAVKEILTKENLEGYVQNITCNYDEYYERWNVILDLPEGRVERTIIPKHFDAYFKEKVVPGDIQKKIVAPVKELIKR